MKSLFPKSNFLVYLAILSFVFIASSSLALSGGFKELTPPPTYKQEKSFPPVPKLKFENPSFPVLSAQGAMAVDEDSGVTLYEKNANMPLLPASTTKIVTALVSLDNYPLDSVIKVGKFSVDGQKMGLVTGERITVENLLYGLLVYSANDSAEALARHFEGGRSAFIAAMNKKASEFHLSNTHFYNPSGLDGNGQVTTAHDLVRISEIAMQNPEFAKIVATGQITVASTDGKIVHRLTNINELLGKVPGVLGIKTGWTQNARENLVTYIERDGHRVMIALLGSQDRFGETKELIEWIFKNYNWQEVHSP